MSDVHSRIIFPLDNMSNFEAHKWFMMLRGKIAYFKVGLEMFVSEGPKVLEVLGAHTCMLDLKFNDIPNTMKQATAVAVSYGVPLLTVHASAGKEAMKWCVDATKDSPTNIVAVTLLTSLPFDRIVFERRVEDSIRAGVTHFVCSPNEAKIIKYINHDAVVITPGISLTGEVRDDQKRVNTQFSIIPFSSGATFDKAYY